MDENNIHCTSIWGILLMTINWQQIGMKSKSHKSYKMTDRSVQWMDGLSIAHGSYVDQRPHWLWDTAQHSIFLVNQALTPHLKLFPVTSNLLRLPLVTSGYLFLHGAYPIWFELAVFLLLVNLLHQISTWNIWCRNIWRNFHGKKYGPNSSNFELPESYDDFQKVAKNIEGFWFFFVFLPSYLVCNQIWLNYFLVDRQFGYYHNKILKRNPGTCHEGEEPSVW